MLINSVRLGKINIHELEKKLFLNNMNNFMKFGQTI